MPAGRKENNIRMTMATMRRPCSFVWLMMMLKVEFVLSFHHHYKHDCFVKKTRTIITSARSRPHDSSHNHRRHKWKLASSFYGKFEEDKDDEDDDDDDDDDDYLDLDDASVSDFRSKMSNLYDDPQEQPSTSADSSSSSSVSVSDSVDELISFATSTSTTGEGDQEPRDWATPVEGDARDVIQKGVVLLANPAKFCNDFSSDDDDDSRKRQNRRPNPSLLSKFGLTLPPPADLGPDRRADLLPVLVIVEHDADAKPPNPLLTLGGGGGSGSSSSTAATRGVLLNRRTGYLLGDLEPPSSSTGGSSSEDPSSAAGPAILEKFCIQPLWFGGDRRTGEAPAVGCFRPNRDRPGFCGSLDFPQLIHVINEEFTE